MKMEKAAKALSCFETQGARCFSPSANKRFRFLAINQNRTPQSAASKQKFKKPPRATATLARSSRAANGDNC